MIAPQQPTDHRRHRLAANHNEAIVPDESEDFDIEGHRLAANDNETVVEGATPVDPEADEDDPTPGPRQALTRNHNETIVVDRPERRRHRLPTNHSETIVPDDDDQDTEGHRLATNDNETLIDGDAPADPEANEEDPTPGPRRSLTRNHTEILVHG
jgi:hypothetical protein